MQFFQFGRQPLHQPPSQWEKKNYQSEITNITSFYPRLISLHIGSSSKCIRKVILLRQVSQLCCGLTQGLTQALLETEERVPSTAMGFGPCLLFSLSRGLPRIPGLHAGGTPPDVEGVAPSLSCRAVLHGWKKPCP